MTEGVPSPAGGVERLFEEFLYFLETGPYLLDDLFVFGRLKAQLNGGGAQISLSCGEQGSVGIWSTQRD